MSKHLLEKCVRCPQQVKLDLSRQTKCNELKKFKKCKYIVICHILFYFNILDIFTAKNINLNERDKRNSTDTDNSDSDCSDKTRTVSSFSITNSVSSRATLDYFVDTTSQADEVVYYYNYLNPEIIL